MDDLHEQEDQKMRVLLSFEEEHRLYMEAIAAAIRRFRCDVEVATAEGEELESEMERFDPQLIISGPPLPENSVEDGLVRDVGLARIELSPDPKQPSRFRMGERRWESTNPTLGEILPVVDETKKLYRTTRDQNRSEDAGDQELQ
jgi:hypothetical protein